MTSVIAFLVKSKVYLGNTCNLSVPKYFPLACPINKADDYEIRKILLILISFSMAVNLCLCGKSVKWKYLRI